MNISISTGFYYNKNYIEILDIISESKCKNIELFLNNAFIDLPIETIKSSIFSRNLKVLSIHLPLPFLAYNRDEDEEYWLKKGLEYLKVLDATIITSHFNYQKNNIKLSNDDSHFSLIKEYTKKTDYYICTENLPNKPLKTKHQNSEELLAFLSENNSYITYDTTHAATHDKNIVHEYDYFNNYIRNIHFSDFKDENEHKVLGHGSLPIQQFIKHLKNDNYQFPLTLEYDFEDPARNNVDSNKEAINLLNCSIDIIENICN